MKSTTIFITGTDTGVGKTVLASLLSRFLRERGVIAAALKPICSGGRDDARALHVATEGVLSLDEINPWHFRAPIAPLLAARMERRKIHLADVVAHVRGIQKHFDVLLVEGAGGLLSPLGENFNSRDLIVALRAEPLVVCPDRLGAINQVLLTLQALPRNARAKARVVLISSRRPDVSTKTNSALLAEYFAKKRISLLPWVKGRLDSPRAPENPQVKRALQKLALAV